MLQGGEGVRWQCHGAAMVWCGDDVGAERMQGGEDAAVGGHWCGETMVWDGDGVGW